jgi:hypothetical protein
LYCCSGILAPHQKSHKEWKNVKVAENRPLLKSNDDCNPCLEILKTQKSNPRKRPLKFPKI